MARQWLHIELAMFRRKPSPSLGFLHPPYNSPSPVEKLPDKSQGGLQIPFFTA